MGKKVSQVRPFFQTCDALRCHLRRSVLPPATFYSVTCDVLFCHLRRSILSPATQIGRVGKKVSQVRPFFQACDAMFCHLRRSILSPATLCAVTCDVLFCHLLRKSATGAKKCRRSGEYCRPATLCAVTCDISFCHLRCPVLPPATAPSVTWDV